MMQKIALIIPCYNEENRLSQSNVLALATQHTHVYLCNDGSTDDTLKLLNAIAAQNENCFVVNYSKNTGKGNTIYNTVQHVLKKPEYTHVGYFDADFSTPVSEIQRLISLSGAAPGLFIAGSRILLLNHNIKRKSYRHYIGRLVITIINIKYNLKVYDTQCGAKLFPVHIAETAFSQPFKTSWLFDVELFIRMKRNNLLGQGKEVPLLHWEDVDGSKLGWKSAFRIAAEIFTLYKY